LCDTENRLGARGGIKEIKNHPFFEGIDWTNLRNVKAPYIPDIKNDEDCHRFDKFDEEEPFYTLEDKKGQKRQRKDINFVGYTYKKDVEDQRSKLVQALNESLQPDVVGTEGHSELE
jgi:hypothetical protein